MIDIKKIVYEALSEGLDVPVWHSYPNAITEFPLVSYYELENKNSRYCATEILSDIAFQIDIFDKKIIKDIDIKVDEIMSGMGFNRDFSAEVDDTEGIYRKTMRYTARINTRTLQAYRR